MSAEKKERRKTGMSDAGDFIRQFRKVKEIPPLKYRQFRNVFEPETKKKEKSFGIGL